MIDFHIHLLPGMDDGAQSVAESRAMLQKLASQGITHAVCTPHYYGEKESVQGFLARRDQSAAQIGEIAKELGISLAFGAEIAMWHGMSTEISEQLCPGESNLLLCELPASYSPWIIDELEELGALGYCPMIAHVDRVQALYSKDQLAAVLECRGVVYQFNAGALSKPRVQGLARALCAMGAQMVVGTDGHGEDYRSPDFSPANKALGTWRAKRVRERMERCRAELERAIF